jgi:hypothetical protein
MGTPSAFVMRPEIELVVIWADAVPANEIARAEKRITRLTTGSQARRKAKLREGRRI